MADHRAPARSSDPKELVENPRTTRMRDAVLGAVIELVVDAGAGAVTASRVAEQACVARSTIYDHWPSPASLIRDAIDRIIAPDVSAEITGDLHTDLVDALSALRARLERRPFRVWMATLLEHAEADVDFAEVQVQFVAGVTKPIRQVLTTAVESGELEPDLDVDAACSRLAAPVFTEHVMLRRTATDAMIVTTVRHFLTDQRR